MDNVYAILDAEGGWLVDLVMWTGDTSVWSPPEGTVAQKASEVDFPNLPPNPNEQIF